MEPESDREEEISALEKAIPGGYIEPIDRARLIARGLALIDGGSTVTEASKAVGIRYASLFAKQQERDLDIAVPVLDDPRESLSAAQTAIALAASERIFERIDSNSMSDTNLLRAMSSATATVIALRAQPAKTAENGISLLAKLLESADIQLTKRDGSKDAIDVTPIE